MASSLTSLITKSPTNDSRRFSYRGQDRCLIHVFLGLHPLDLAKKGGKYVAIMDQHHSMHIEKEKSSTAAPQ